MAALQVGAEMSLDDTSFQQFITNFRNAASDLDPLNGFVGILRSVTTRVPDITLEMGKTVIQLHIKNEDSYLLGLKVNQGDWYSLSEEGAPFHFDDAQQAIGFGEGYGDLGYSDRSDLKRIGLGYASLRGAMDGIRNFCENRLRGDDRLIKKWVAIVILTVCEAARFHSVQQEIESLFKDTENPSPKLSVASVGDIKSWMKQQKLYCKNQADYKGDLRLVKKKLLAAANLVISGEPKRSTKLPFRDLFRGRR